MHDLGLKQPISLPLALAARRTNQWHALQFGFSSSARHPHQPFGSLPEHSTVTISANWCVIVIFCFVCQDFCSAESSHNSCRHFTEVLPSLDLSLRRHAHPANSNGIFCCQGLSPHKIFTKLDIPHRRKFSFGLILAE